MENSAKKNIVLLIPQLRHGGAERVVSKLSFLLKEDFNVNTLVFDDSIVTYDMGSQLDSLNVPSSSKNGVISKGLNVIKRIVRFRKYKSENNIDITYSFGDTANIVNIFSRGKDKKVISIRGYKRIRIGKNLMERIILRPISVMLCNKADRIVSVSQLITETLVKEYNLQHDKVSTIQNGYDVSAIKELSKESLDLQEEKFFANNTVIITAGTFRYEKGYWHLLKAFSIVLNNNKNLKLVILGTDYKNNRAKAEKLARDLGILESILFLGYKENPYKYFSKSNVYVLASIFEGFPNALVEAMSCGVPVVATDCPSGPREILSPSSQLYEICQKSELSEYGILTPKMNPLENYDSSLVENCDIELAEGIDQLLKKDNNIYYKNKSFQRSKDFDYKTWIIMQKQALSFNEAGD